MQVWLYIIATYCRCWNFRSSQIFLNLVISQSANKCSREEGKCSREEGKCSHEEGKCSCEEGKCSRKEIGSETPFVFRGKLLQTTTFWNTTSIKKTSITMFIFYRSYVLPMLQNIGLIRSTAMSDPIIGWALVWESLFAHTFQIIRPSTAFNSGSTLVRIPG